MATRTSRVRVLVLALGVAAAPVGADERAAERAGTEWDRIPLPELNAIWEEAQGTGGVVAVEPDSQVIGAAAANKKFSGLFSIAKVFVGDQPIWFPADFMRRTVCGTPTFWSYHPLADNERDLHPWIPAPTAFAQLVGRENAQRVLESRILDVSLCEEVGGDGTDCFYGEVTPSEKFEQWFCRGRCSDRLRADPGDVVTGFADPALLCWFGPWVLERVHDWRPEIHPAELMWARHVPPEQAWTIAVVPDRSGRFVKAKHFTAIGSATRVPWSRPRPAELWIAYSFDETEGTAIDLAVDDLTRPAKPIELRPDPAAAGFQTLHAGKGLQARSRAWAAPGGPPRGLLVLSTDIHSKDAAVIDVRVRSARDRQPPPQRVRARAAGTRTVPAAAVRLMAFDPARREKGLHHVETLVRFDPLRPPEPADEAAAKRLNEALKKGGGRSREAFGVERPFRIDWTLTAHREEGCVAVPVVVGEPAASPLPDAVIVKAKPGKVTTHVTVNRPPGAPDAVARADKFKDVVSAGALALSIPEGVMVVGEGELRYLGEGVGLKQDVTPLHFELPVPAYRDEWHLIEDVLAHIDGGSAARRLQALKTAACLPYGPDCTVEALSSGVAASVRDPVQRWALLRQLREPASAFARFARHLAIAFLADRELEFQEYGWLDRLLRETYDPDAPAPAVVRRGRCAAAPPVAR